MGEGERGGRKEEEEMKEEQGRTKEHLNAKIKSFCFLQISFKRFAHDNYCQKIAH